MGWVSVRPQRTESKFIKFEDGKAVEGIYLGSEQRTVVFGGHEKVVYDHKFKIGEEEKVLSSSSTLLKEQLETAGVGQKVRVEMRQAGIKKLYNVLVWQE